MPGPRLEHAHRGGRLLGHRRAEVRPRGQRGAELDVLLGVDLEVAEAGHRRQQVGVLRAEHELGLDGREGAQAEAVAQVALQAAQAALVEPLRGQQQMDAQRAPHPAEPHEQVDELRPRRQQLGELVDDDQQVGHRRHRRIGLAARLVGDDVVEVAGLAQHRLAALLLADQRGVHAVDERQVALQVGDQARHVREPGQVGEGGAALVVDEHERELLGAVGGGQAGHQRAQQLALARSGGPHQHAVRAHAALGGLLEVELEDLAVGGAPDRRAQAERPRTRAPRGLGVERVGRRQPQQVDEPHVHAQAALAVAALRQPQGGQRARRRLGRAQIDVVEEHLGDRRRVLTPQLPRAGAALGHGEPRVDVRRLELVRVGEQDQHALELAGAREQLAEGGQLVRRVVGPVAVEDHDQLGRHERDLPPADTGLGDPPQLLQARPQLGLEQAVELAHRPREQEAARDIGIDALMRQPLPPLPVVGVLGVEHGQQTHVVRGAPGGELVHQRARPRARVPAVAGDGEHPDLGEIDHHRLTAQRASALDELARLLERVRLVLGERVHAEVELDLAVQRHVAGAEPDVQEIAVIGPALPHVRALDQQCPQPAWIGIQARQRAALELAGLGQLAVALAQVLGVAPRLVGRALADPALLRPAHAEREQQQQQDHRAGDVEEQGVAVDQREADHADAAHDREQHLDDRGVRRRRLRRRRRDPQPLRGHGRRVLPGRAMEGQRVLCCHLCLHGYHRRRSFIRRCLLASVRVPVIATSNRSKGRQPGCPTSP